MPTNASALVQHKCKVQVIAVHFQQAFPIVKHFPLSHLVRLCCQHQIIFPQKNINHKTEIKLKIVYQFLKYLNKSALKKYISILLFADCKM